MIDDLEIREWCKIRTAAILRSRADETNGSRDNAGNQKLVVEYSRSSFSIRINFNMRDLQRCTAVVRSIAIFPIRFDGLFEIPRPDYDETVKNNEEAKKLVKPKVDGQ